MKTNIVGIIIALILTFVGMLSVYAQDTKVSEVRKVDAFSSIEITSVGTIYFTGEFYQFNLSSCIRQQNSLTAQFVSFSLANLANIFYPPPRFLQ